MTYNVQIVVADSKSDVTYSARLESSVELAQTLRDFADQVDGPVGANASVIVNLPETLLRKTLAGKSRKRGA